MFMKGCNVEYRLPIRNRKSFLPKMYIRFLPTDGSIRRFLLTFLKLLKSILKVSVAEAVKNM